MLHQAHAQLDDQRGHDLRGAAEHAGVEQHRHHAPLGVRRQARPATRQCLPRQPLRHPGDEQQTPHAQRSLGSGLLQRKRGKLVHPKASWDHSGRRV